MRSKTGNCGRCWRGGARGSGGAAVGELRRVPILDALEDGELREVLEGGFERLVRAGAINGREGEPVEHLYVILEGELRITKEADGGEMTINVYTSGAFFAEVPLLAGTPFLATGRALTDCRLFLIPEDLFRRLLTNNAAFSNTVLPTLADGVRILQSLAGQREHLNSLSTLAAGPAPQLTNPPPPAPPPPPPPPAPPTSSTTPPRRPAAPPKTRTTHSWTSVLTA